MKIIIYSKPGCAKCELAKKKIRDKFGMEYEEKELSDFLLYHTGWREDGSVELMAWATEQGDPFHQLPTIEIDGEFYDYPSAMKKLKGR